VVTTASDIDSFIRTQREAAQVSVRQLAERPVLHQIERGLHKPTADVLNQIAKALPESGGAIREAGILEHTETSAARDAIITRHDDYPAAEAGSARHLLLASPTQRNCP